MWPVRPLQMQVWSCFLVVFSISHYLHLHTFRSCLVPGEPSYRFQKGQLHPDRPTLADLEPVQIRKWHLQTRKQSPGWTVATTPTCWAAPPWSFFFFFKHISDEPFAFIPGLGFSSHVSPLLNNRLTLSRKTLTSKSRI